MQKVMIVSDLFMLAGHGVVMCGENPELDSMCKEEILNLIGPTLVVRNMNGEKLIVEILGAEISTSLIGRKSISIRLGDKIKKSDIDRGAIVYSSS